MKHPQITINGVQLTEAQAITLRVALLSAEFDCSHDDIGLNMQRAYRARKAEIIAIMHPQETAQTAIRVGARWRSRKGKKVCHVKTIASSAVFIEYINTGIARWMMADEFLKGFEPYPPKTVEPTASRLEGADGIA